MKYDQQVQPNFGKTVICKREDKFRAKNSSEKIRGIVATQHVNLARFKDYLAPTKNVHMKEKAYKERHWKGCVIDWFHYTKFSFYATIRLRACIV